MIQSGSDEFYYEGFEQDAGASATNPYAGKKHYSGDYTLPFVKPNSRTYEVNYHYLDGTEWKNMTKSFSDNMTLTEGSSIDEVRVYPADALMTTYTYDPLIGMTSETNPNGLTTFYEYDELTRLTLIRDQEGNVIRKICYNYAGQPEDCFGNNLPAWENTTTATRCKQINGLNTGEIEQEQQDVNPSSSTYNQLQWVVVGTNTTACPVQTCNSSNCVGEDKKCINGTCETGSKICTSSVRINHNTWLTTYHYVWSDLSVSPDYQEYGPPCILD
jgi:YD repeat-containing protein